MVATTSNNQRAVPSERVPDPERTGKQLENGTSKQHLHSGYSDQRPGVSLVIPAMNEAKNIAWVLLRVPGWVKEVILVDGNSTDGTREVAEAICPNIVVVNDPGRGKGAALRAGFAAASCDFIVMIDADGSMDPAEIGRYAAALSSDFDLVKGSRFMTGAGSTDITLLRKSGNGALRMLLNRLYGVRLTDLCYGYCAFRKDCLPRMNLRSDGFEIETEIAVQALNAGLRICEVPSHESPRGHGESNLSTFRDGFRVLRMMLGAWLTPRGNGIPPSVTQRVQTADTAQLNLLEGSWLPESEWSLESEPLRLHA